MSKVILKGWIARNDEIYRHNELNLYFDKPIRDGNYGWKSNLTSIPLDNNAFDIKWVDNPVEVNIIVTDSLNIGVDLAEPNSKDTSVKTIWCNDKIIKEEIL